MSNLKQQTLGFLFLILFIFPNINIAQTDVDSLKSIWINSNEPDSVRIEAIRKFYALYTFSQPDSVFPVTRYHYNFAKEKNLIFEMAESKNQEAAVFYVKGEPNKSMPLLIDAIELLEEINDSISLARYNANIGILYSEQKKFQEAIKYYTAGLEIFKAKKDLEKEIFILNNIGIVYLNINQYDLAIEYFNKAMKGESRRQKGNIWLNLGATYFELKDYNKAISNAKKGIQLLKSENNKFGVANGYYTLAKSYHSLNELDSCNLYIDKSLAMDKAMDHDNRSLERHIFKTRLIAEHDNRKATQAAEALLNQLNPNINNEQKVDLYHLLYQCYRKEGRIELSLKMHEKYSSFKDSLQVEKNQITLIRDAIQSDFDTKLYETQLENEKERSKLKLSQLRRIYTIGAISAISIFVFFWSLRNIKRRNQREQESLLQELEELKNKENSTLIVPSPKFTLNREKIESSIDRKLNETDWNILKILLDDPVISNKDIAKKAFMSVDGIGSSLIRMYTYFDIKHSKYKKISLIMDAIKRSN